MTDTPGIPGLFSDSDDFIYAFNQALNKVPVAEVVAFNQRLASAVVAGDRAVWDLAISMVIAERLSTNGDYKAAVKDVEQQDAATPPAAIDHRRLISTLRAG